MTRTEIIEGLKKIYYRVYAITDYRKTLEACFGLLESENALIDCVLEIIGGYKADEPSGVLTATAYNTLLARMERDVLALKGGEQE